MLMRRRRSDSPFRRGYLGPYSLSGGMRKPTPEEVDREAALYWGAPKPDETTAKATLGIALAATRYSAAFVAFVAVAFDVERYFRARDPSGDAFVVAGLALIVV